MTQRQTEAMEIFKSMREHSEYYSPEILKACGEGMRAIEKVDKINSIVEKWGTNVYEANELYKVGEVVNGN